MNHKTYSKHETKHEIDFWISEQSLTRWRFSQISRDSTKLTFGVNQGRYGWINMTFIWPPSISIQSLYSSMKPGIITLKISILNLGADLVPGSLLVKKYYYKMWWFCQKVISDAEGNLHNCKGKHTSCICRPNDVIKYVYVLSCACSLILIATIILREYFFRIITDVMKIQDSTK